MNRTERAPAVTTASNAAAHLTLLTYETNVAGGQAKIDTPEDAAAVLDQLHSAVQAIGMTASNLRDNLAVMHTEGRLTTTQDEPTDDDLTPPNAVRALDEAAHGVETATATLLAAIDAHLAATARLTLRDPGAELAGFTPLD